MRDKVLAWMRAQDMTQPGDTVVCAVSGGADSVCMLHVLLSLRDALGITVEAAHFNHHLRGAESDRDEAFVRQLCKTLGVHLYVDGGDVQSRAACAHESIEEAARKLRYTFFSSLPGLIATAHTQDDNLETVLLNLTRGTGLTGLCGVPPKRENLIRPMLPCSRAEIEDYLKKNGLSYVTDSSNLLPDVRRNRLRQRVIPLLKEENPSLVETAFRMCRILTEDNHTLQQQAMQALQSARLPDGLRCSALRAYPDAVRTRAVRLFLSDIHVPKLSQAHIDAVDRLLFSDRPSAFVCLPGGTTARRDYDRLYLCAASPISGFAPVQLLPGQSCVLPDAGFRVSCRIEENFTEIQNTLSTFAVKYDTIDYHSGITVRPRQPQDSMRVRGGRKTLKRLMIDHKIPAAIRASVPVVCGTCGVLGVYGIGVSLDRAAAAGERAVIITIEEIEKEDQRYD